MLSRTSPRGKKSRSQRLYRPVMECLESRHLLSFMAPMNYAAGSGPIAMVAGDFNGDGIPDLAVAGLSGVNVLLGNGDGTFQPAHNYVPEAVSYAVAVGDFNGDGIQDLAVANIRNNNILVLLGNGDGTFQDAPPFTAGSVPISIAVGDVNGDGIPDLAVANDSSNDVSLLLGKGDGTFQDGCTLPAGSNPAAVTLGDVNGDGTPDLVVADSAQFEGTPGVSVLLGNGDGTFQPATTFAAGSGPIAVALGDFNGDGLPDLAIANYLDNSVSILLGNGDGTFQDATTLAAGTNPRSVAVGDVNSDGIQDLAVAGVEGVTIFLGQGDGTFQIDPNTYAAGANPTSLALADLNGDGYPDVAVANHDSNDVSILLNDTIWAPHVSDSFHHQPAAHPALSNPQGIFPVNFVFTTEQPDPQRVSPEISIGQPAQGDVMANRPLRGTAQDASDAMFETWDSPIGDELAVYLMQPSGPRSDRLLLPRQALPI